MVFRDKTTFPSPHGPDVRTTYFYLPKSYDSRSDRRYPVLYMFDGHNLFFDTDATYGKCWGLGEYLDSTDTQIIVAGVECSHDPQGGRLMEYSPYNFTSGEFGRMAGFGAATMDWFIDVFKPEVDRRFRTLPDRGHTFIGGSSMGGLMSLYAVLRHNDVFSRCIALSPSVWANNQKMLELAKTAKLGDDTVVYMDYGSEELANHSGMQKKFFDVSASLAARGIYVCCRLIPHGTHCEASWERQLPVAMGTMLYDMKTEVNDDGNTVL